MVRPAHQQRRASGLCRQCGIPCAPAARCPKHQAAAREACRRSRAAKMVQIVCPSCRKSRVVQSVTRGGLCVSCATRVAVRVVETTKALRLAYPGATWAIEIVHPHMAIVVRVSKPTTGTPRVYTTSLHAGHWTATVDVREVAGLPDKSPRAPREGHPCARAGCVRIVDPRVARQARASGRDYAYCSLSCSTADRGDPTPWPCAAEGCRNVASKEGVKSAKKARRSYAFCGLSCAARHRNAARRAERAAGAGR